MKFLGTETLETKRLILRKINEDDYKQAFKNWCNSDAVDKYVTWTKHNSEEETKENAKTNPLIGLPNNSAVFINEDKIEYINDYYLFD